MKHKLDKQIKELLEGNTEYLTCPTCKKLGALQDERGAWRCIWNDCSAHISYSELMSIATANRLRLLKTDIKTLKRLGLWI